MGTFLAIVGAFLGAGFGGAGGALIGLAAGLVLAGQLKVSDRFAAIERRLDALEDSPASKPAPSERPPYEPPPAVQPEPPAVQSAAPPPTSPITPRPPPSQPKAPPPRPQPNAIERGLDVAMQRIKLFFTTGNVVVKVGVIVLFFGVALLLKYAADRNVLPIEVRLVGVALGGIAMLLFGYRQRRARRTFALALQGGAIGVLYLTVFAAAKLYGVLPLGLGMLLMLALVALSGFLAIVQDAHVLAALGSAGGFLAPVLTSSGGGSHVVLFSYYAILNVGILGIAWFKAWRYLNLLGFGFTFVIGSLWGFQYYRTRHFETTEPFLILSFLFYLVIALLFAHRQPPKLRGYVDGTLVFGLPLVVFGLQSSLVDNFAFGRAYSALGMGAIYLLLARWLWHKQIAGMHMLVEAFLALGVIFVSLAIPFAIDGHWTAAAWSLEGAGLIWAGLRQRRLSPRIFGLLLHFGAAVLFFFAAQLSANAHAIFNSALLGSVFIALGALFSSYCYARHGDELRDWEHSLETITLVWALLWWFGAGIAEINDHVSRRFEPAAIVLFFAVSAELMRQLHQHFNWQKIQWPPLLLLPGLAYVALAMFLDQRYSGPVTHLGWLAWPVGLGVSYRLLQHFQTQWRSDLVEFWHAGSLWLITALLSWSAYWLIDLYLPAPTWPAVAWGLVPAATVLGLSSRGQAIRWPVNAFPNAYAGWGLIPLVVVAVGWTVAASRFAGRPYPLPYLPLINPLDITAMFVFLTGFDWSRKNANDVLIPLVAVTAGLAAAAFLWANVAIARAVHFLDGVSYRLEPLYRSATLQTSIALLWSLVALSLMVFANRSGRRTVWFVGLGLLILLVGKLFLIDLAGSGTIARIVSFLGAGALMLVIGYLAPAPPRNSAEVTDDDASMDSA